MSFGADLFGDSEGALHQGFEVSGDCTGVASYRVSLFHLSENLGFAHDHAVERTGYAEEVANRFALAKLVKMGLDVVRWNGEVLVQEAEEIRFGLRWCDFGVVLKGEEFDPITGGEDQAFANARLMDKGAGGVGEALGGYGEALAYLDGRGVMVDAE